MITTIKKHFFHIVRTVKHAAHEVRSTGRSALWPRVSHAFLAKNPFCAACGGQKNLNVHHMVPFHLDSSKELDTGNFIVLCMDIGKHCHLMLGHGNNFKAFNPKIKHDAELARAARQRGELGLVKDLEAKAKKERLYEVKAL